MLCESVSCAAGQERILLEVFRTGMWHETREMLEIKYEGLDFTWNVSIWNNQQPGNEVTQPKWLIAAMIDSKLYCQTFHCR